MQPRRSREADPVAVEIHAPTGKHDAHLQHEVQVAARRRRQNGGGHQLQVLTRHGFEGGHVRSEEHTSELQSLMRISYAVFCLKKKKTKYINKRDDTTINTTTT